MYKNLIFEFSGEGRRGHVLPKVDVPQKNIDDLIPKSYLREKLANLPQVAENEVVRHYTNLSELNHNVDKSFYPLGSCTMKYNPKINEKLAGLAGFVNLHPRQPAATVQGALQVIYDLQEILMAITGFDAITLQPVAGAQGELTGLLMMRKYHLAKGRNPNIILAPDSAHGTNPASVVTAGFTVKIVRSNENGMVDLADLEEKVDENVAGIMLTNPSTLGIFETQTAEIRRIMDRVDGLMYMDGANMNALFGIVRPGDMGFDVMHLNLHKSFSTPHGGGGPGSGPVAVNAKLEPYLPVPRVEKNGNEFVLNNNVPASIGRVQSFYGNFALLVRAYIYCRMVGKEGFHKVAEHAIINANYLRKRLTKKYKLGYDAPTMHEFVLSAEEQKNRGAKALDIAKRLLDFGVHPPTVYFPLIVKEAMMIEPTETESREMLDYFVEALLKIDREIDEDIDVVLNAPHSTPVKRLDEAAAARNLDINFYKKN